MAVRGVALACPRTAGGAAVESQDLTSQDANELCAAASAIFFSVVCCESERRRAPICLPELLCPERPEFQCPCRFDTDLLAAAEDFLLRLGVIYFDDHYRPRLSFK